MRVPAFALRHWILVLACGGLLLCPHRLHGGAEVLLYPFARAFGSPSEAELARCRAAFREVQATLPTTIVRAAPVLVVNADEETRSAEWRTEAAARLAARLSATHRLHVAAIADPPSVPGAVLGHNQMRYAWQRAASYASAVKRTAPAEPMLFTEVWVNAGHVAALHVFVCTPSGEIAYCRWFNSHQFGPALNFERAGWIDFIAAHLVRDFASAPEKVFPRYGVG